MMRFFIFICSLALISFVSCNSREASELEGMEKSTIDKESNFFDADSVQYYKLDLAKDGETLEVHLKRGSQKTILEFPTAGTETNLKIKKEGGLIEKMDYYLGDRKASRQFVITTDANNINKEEVYQANYLSCSQFGYYKIVIN